MSLGNFDISANCDECDSRLYEGDEVFCDECFRRAFPEEMADSELVRTCGACKAQILRHRGTEKLEGFRCFDCARKLEEKLLAQMQ